MEYTYRVCMVYDHDIVCFLYNKILYRRSGFDCEILLIANCGVFHNSQSKESQEKIHN